MMKYERTHRCFRIHHEAFGQLYADVFGVQKLPDAGLVFERGTGRVAEAVPVSAIFRRKALNHCHVGRVGESPVLADSSMQPLGAAFGGFKSQRLYRVRLQVFAARFVFLAALPDASAGGDDKEADRIT